MCLSVLACLCVRVVLRHCSPWQVEPAEEEAAAILGWIYWQLQTPTLQLPHLHLGAWTQLLWGRIISSAHLCLVLTLLSSFSVFWLPNPLSDGTLILFSWHPQRVKQPRQSILQRMVLCNVHSSLKWPRWHRGGSRDSWSVNGTAMGCDPMTLEQSPCRD